MDDVNIRLALPNDAAELARLRFALRSRAEGDVESEADFLDRCAAWITHALQQPNWLCWLAERDGMLVGTLWLQLIEKIPNPASESEYFAYITSFFISESIRGKGLGSRMLSKAISWCRENDVHTALLWPTDRSRSLYHRYGFATPDEILALVIQSE